MSQVETNVPEIDSKVIVPFVNSVRSVFSAMLGLQVTVDRPHIKHHNMPGYDYSGIIGFSGGIIGTVVVGFHSESAVNLVSAFAGVDIAPDTPDFVDAIGELANMIAGAAKKDLGAAANISVPSVISGKNHTVARPSDIPCLVVPCKTSNASFVVEISIKTAPKAG